ncbi:MAG: GPW/gp25 family protein [bacterium]
MAVYSDIDINLETRRDGDIKILEDEDSIKNSLLNMFNIMQGSRRMLPDFASHIHRLLFEPMDDVTVDLLRESFEDSIDKYEPRVIVERINMNPDYENLTYNIKVSYLIVDLGLRDEVDFLLEKL